MLRINTVTYQRGYGPIPSHLRRVIKFEFECTTCSRFSLSFVRVFPVNQHKYIIFKCKGCRLEHAVSSFVLEWHNYNVGTIHGASEIYT